MKYIKQPRRHIVLDDFEWRALVKGINEYRKQVIDEDGCVEVVNKLPLTRTDGFKRIEEQSKARNAIHSAPDFKGSSTSERKRSSSTFPPGVLRRSGVRCSGLRKKSSIWNTVQPISFCKSEASVVFPAAHLPSMAISHLCSGFLAFLMISMNRVSSVMMLLQPLALLYQQVL